MSAPARGAPRLVSDDDILVVILAGHRTPAALAKRLGYTGAGVRVRVTELIKAGRLKRVPAHFEVIR